VGDRDRNSHRRVGLPLKLSPRRRSHLTHTGALGTTSAFVFEVGACAPPKKRQAYSVGLFMVSTMVLLAAGCCVGCEHGGWCLLLLLGWLVCRVGDQCGSAVTPASMLQSSHCHGCAAHACELVVRQCPEPGRLVVWLARYRSIQAW
jgi:hypothetical protein